MNSTSVFLRPCTWVYIVLIALTFTTYAVGELGLGGLSFALLVLGIALVKGYLVGDFFMGLHGLSGPWRWVILIWLTLIGGLITLAFTRTA
ncbi:MAG: cytochrome C oxidase subunit IV family protein [Chromatiaceae bacterium]